MRLLADEVLVASQLGLNYKRALAGRSVVSLVAQVDVEQARQRAGGQAGGEAPRPRLCEEEAVWRSLVDLELQVTVFVSQWFGDLVDMQSKAA